MTSWKITGLALAASLGCCMLGGHASAMPADGLRAAASDAAGAVEDVRWVCGPYRCWWAPGPSWGYGPGPYWHRGWRHRW